MGDENILKDFVKQGAERQELYKKICEECEISLIRQFLSLGFSEHHGEFVAFVKAWLKEKEENEESRKHRNNFRLTLVAIIVSFIIGMAGIIVQLVITLNR